MDIEKTKTDEVVEKLIDGGIDRFLSPHAKKILKKLISIKALEDDTEDEETIGELITDFFNDAIHREIVSEVAYSIANLEIENCGLSEKTTEYLKNAGKKMLVDLIDMNEKEVMVACHSDAVSIKEVDEFQKRCGIGKYKEYEAQETEE